MIQGGVLGSYLLSHGCTLSLNDALLFGILMDPGSCSLLLVTLTAPKSPVTFRRHFVVFALRYSLFASDTAHA